LASSEYLKNFASVDVDDFSDSATFSSDAFLALLASPATSDVSLRRARRVRVDRRSWVSFLKKN
jgi:hypothetical protein